MRRFSPELEAQIAHMRAELLRQEQDRQRAEAQLAVEKEERERAQRKVSRGCPGPPFLLVFRCSSLSLPSA